ncbi:hypothetical protein Zmor_007590 [Zophobas morio]|uniref:Sodium-coupled monocarboxylate transporter 1 n=1 Tax=Zophobas morio TaxID=2755281 RepID=A0AA38ITW5_9CUCU|nr:hypothetical protein Zmor_007590 [Zophobas morio]
MATFTTTEPTTVLQHVLKNVSQLTFSWYDYIFFSVMLCLSALIGIYFGCFGSKQSSADEYLMGNKKMKVLPISISLVASHISGITLLAVPADVYRYGAAYWLGVPSLIIVGIVTMYIYLPVFYKLQITSTYEYLERRFDSTNRTFASFLFALGLFLYLPIVIYVPALAFSAASRIQIHYITPVVCGVCIFYTTLGGLKAVVWTDTLQFTVTTGAVFTVVIVGVRAAGGFAAVWTRAAQGDRLNFFDFDPNPTKHDSFWTVFIGICVHWIGGMAIHQSCVQKYLSVSTFHKSKLTVVYFFIGIVIMCTLSVFTGLIMYSRYFSCDPFTTGVVQKNDQLLPYYIMDVASHIPGLSGLFMAGIFCAALSTLSACLNCLAGTVFEDFVVKITGPIQNEKTAATILKILVLVAGVICTLLVLVVERLGGVLSLAISLGGVTSGPLLGMFTLGVLFPKASSKGAFYGSIIGLLFMGWIATMSHYYKAAGVIVDIPKPTTTEGCSFVANASLTSSAILESRSSLFENFTTESAELQVDNLTSVHLPKSETPLGNPNEQVFALFRLSVYYYTLSGCLVTIACGLLISYLFHNDDPPVNRDLISPVIYFLLPEEKIVFDAKKNYYSLDKALHLVTTMNFSKESDEKIKN